MTFKIEPKTSFATPFGTSGGQTPKIRIDNAKDEASAIFDSTQLQSQQEENTEGYQKSKATNAARLDLGSIQNAIENGQAALETIEELATKRLEITKLAAEQAPVSAYAADLQAEADAIESEIRRVKAAATYNGSSTIAGNTYQYSDSESDISRSVSTANLGLFSAAVADLGSEAGIETAVDDATNALAAVRSLSSSYNNASSKATAIISDVTTETQRVSATDDTSGALEKAQALAAKLASEISSTLPDEAQANDLIEAAASGLDPNRVYDLLS
jgi:hypothetical protein